MAGNEAHTAAARSYTPMQVVVPPDLPPPGGHYSYAVVANGMVHISGLLPIDEDGRPMATADFDAQVGRVLHNLESVLNSAGVTKENLVQVRVYLSSIEHWSRFNTLYAAWMEPHRPARAIVPTNGLHFGLALEVEALALC